MEYSGDSATRMLALKAISKASISSIEDLSDILMEREIGILINKNNIDTMVNLVCCFQDKSYFFMVMPFLCATLLDVLAIAKKYDEIYKYIAASCVKILEDLKIFRIMHRDIKVRLIIK